MEVLTITRVAHSEYQDEPQLFTQMDEELNIIRYQYLSGRITAEQAVYAARLVREYWQGRA